MTQRIILALLEKMYCLKDPCFVLTFFLLMPPRSTRKKPEPKQEEANEPEESAVSGEYFEIGMADLKVAPPIGSSESEVIEISSEDESITAAKPFSLSRKVRLQLRRVHLMSELVTLKHFATSTWKASELAAMAVSVLPAHILRIFNPVSLSSPEGSKSLKNCVGMLATWWKNNIGTRMGAVAGIDSFRTTKSTQLKAALLNKNAYEDDSVRVNRRFKIAFEIKIF